MHAASQLSASMSQLNGLSIGVGFWRIQRFTYRRRRDLTERGCGMQRSSGGGRAAEMTYRLNPNMHDQQTHSDSRNSTEADAGTV